MKNLLVTTSLVTLFAASAFADAPMDKGPFDLKLTGTVNAQVGSNLTRHKSSAATSPNNKRLAIDSEVLLGLDLKAKTAKGLMYGAHIGIAPNTRSNTNTAKHIASRTYLFTESHDMGRLELGSNEGAADMMMIGAGSIAAATKGVNGDWSKYMSLPDTGTTIRSGDFIVNPTLPLDNLTLYTAGNTLTGLLNGNTEKARKITYLTPVFEGVQAGISYIPDAINVGSFALLPNNTTVKNQNDIAKNALTAGIWWNGTVAKDQRVKVSLTGNYARLNTPANWSGTVAGTSYSTSVKPTQAVAIGAEWTSRDFSVAGSFGWLGKSGQINVTPALPAAALARLGTPASFSNAWYATAGVGMRADKLYTSLTGSYSKGATANKLWNISLGADYEVAPGFMPYAELTYLDFKQKATGGNNPDDLSGPSINNTGMTALVNGVAPAIATQQSSKNTGLVLILGTRIKF